MIILNVMTCYNSLDIMPYVIKYYKSEGIESFVLDNYSNDGSWEYLQKNKIPSKRVDTKGSFDLPLLQEAKCEVIKKLKPTWIIKSDSDSFVITPGSLIYDIEKIHYYTNGNIICMPSIRLWNTGEKKKNLDPRKSFFRYSYVKNHHVPFVHKFDGFIEYKDDRVIMKIPIEKTINNSCCLDYGNTRDKEKREEEFRRRKKAWKNGLKKSCGNHYHRSSKNNWIWNAKDFKDIRKSKYWQAINNRFNGD